MDYYRVLNVTRSVVQAIQFHTSRSVYASHIQLLLFLRSASPKEIKQAYLRLGTFPTD